MPQLEAGLITSWRKRSSCVSKAKMYELTYAFPITPWLIRALDQLGTLEYFPEFPRPFYRLTVRDSFQLKGVEGAPSARLIIFRGEVDAICRKIGKYIDPDAE